MTKHKTYFRHKLTGEVYLSVPVNDRHSYEPVRLASTKREFVEEYILARVRSDIRCCPSIGTLKMAEEVWNRMNDYD